MIAYKNNKNKRVIKEISERAEIQSFRNLPTSNLLEMGNRREKIGETIL